MKRLLASALLLVSLGLAAAPILEQKTPASVLSPILNNPTSTGTDSGTETLSNKTLNCANNTLTGLQSTCKLVDVMASGAKCDGTTDDTASIQAAVNVLATGYGTVVFPDAKTCKTTSTIQVSQNGVVLQGPDEYSTFIDFEPAATIASVAITGTAGQFSCACTGLAVGETIKISGTLGGTGSITGYSNPTTYYVSSVTGTLTAQTAFTLKSLYTTTTAPAAIVTTAGTLSGLTFALASASAFRFAGAGEIFDDGLMGISLFSNNSTTTKTGVEVIDSSAFDLANVVIGAKGVLWTGGAAVLPDTQAGSIGTRLRGREAYLLDRIGGQQDRPLVISANPNAFNTVEDCNECQFFNLYLQQSGNNVGPLIWADDGIALSAMVFDGIQAWVGGTYGIYYNNTVGTVSSYANSFNNVVWEQPSGSSGYAFYINENSSGSQFQQMTITNATIQGSNGILLVGCHFCDIKNSTYTPSSGTFISLVGNDYNISWEAAQVKQGASVSISGQTLVDSLYSPDNTTIPAWARYLHTGQTAIPQYGYSTSDGSSVTAQTITGGAGVFTTINGVAPGTAAPLSQSGIPFGIGPSGFMTATGVYVIGKSPASAATATFGATSGSTTITFSAGTPLTGTAADVGRVITILDTTYKYFTITTGTSSTVATGTLSATLSGTGPFANANVWISGTSSTTNTAGADATMYPAPLGKVYPNIYLYFSASSPIGVAETVYCVMASTTEGTCYNNVISGTPTIPGSPTAFSGLTPAFFTQDSAAFKSILTVSMAGGSLGANGQLDCDIETVENNTAGNKQFGVSYGGSTLGSTWSQSTSLLGRQWVKMWNRGVTNSQGATAGNGANGGFGTGIGSTSLSVNSTAAQNVVIQINIPAATDNAIVESYSLKLTPSS